MDFCCFVLQQMLKSLLHGKTTVRTELFVLYVFGCDVSICVCVISLCVPERRVCKTARIQ